MRAKEWAALEGLNEQTVWKWCREGLMPVPVEKVGGLWFVHDPKYEAPPVHAPFVMRASRPLTRKLTCNVKLTG